MLAYRGPIENAGHMSLPLGGVRIHIGRTWRYDKRAADRGQCNNIGSVGIMRPDGETERMACFNTGI